MSAIESLHAKRAQVAVDIEALTAAVQAENRAMTPDEDQKFKALDSEYRSLGQSIDNFKRTEEIKAASERPQDRATSVTELPTAAQAASTTFRPEAHRQTTSITGEVVAHRFQNHGFDRGFGQYLMAVRDAKVQGKIDPRLMVNAITTFGGEQVGADGAWALPPEFQRSILQTVMAPDSFLGALNPVQTSSNLLVVPADEDAPWGTSGVTAAKTAEGAAITVSKPAFKKTNIVIYDVKSLVHVSNQALSDIPFLASYVQDKMGQKLRWKMENYVVNGTGVDEPTGILNAPGLLAIADDAYSDANTLAPETIGAMVASRLPGSGAFFLAHPTVGPRVWFSKTGTAGYPLFTPDIKQGPGGMLLGLPLYFSEACKAFNTQGDIILVVPSGYILALNGGVNAASTIAFAFDQDLSSFRAVIRMGGEPTLSGTVTRADGTNKISNLVALQARS